ncbi:Uncharacterised protein [Mycobacterium tuberculosis]|nr:Uncharacterised protein [Mycobacterium tuberculosis]
MWNDSSKPAKPDSAALATAIPIMPVMSRDQNRAMPAGRIINPTASSVPRA